MNDMVSALYLVGLVGAVIHGFRRGVQGWLVATVFFIPWFGLMKDVGLTVNADRLVGLVLLVVLALRYRTGALSIFSLFVLYFVVVTLALSLSLPSSTAEYAAARAQWRWAFQLVMWPLLIAPGAALARLASRSAISATLRALCLSGTILGAMAIVQFVVYYATGLDLFPLGLADGANHHAAFETDSFLGGMVFRASALGGEPKHLAYTLVTCLTVLATERVFGGLMGLGRRALVAALAIDSVALVLTFSTQGFVLFAVNATILLAGAALVRGRSRRAVGVLLLLPVGAALLLAVPQLSEVLYQRSVARMMETGGVEDWNEAVWAWFKDCPSAWPLGVGLGNVHLYAADYIPVQYLFYMRGNVFVAKAGALRLLSELGVVGAGLFLLTALRPLRALMPGMRAGSSAKAAAWICGSAAVLDFLISNDGPTYVFLFIGLAAAAAEVVKAPAIVLSPAFEVRRVVAAD